MIKLDIGCGPSVMEGYAGVDLHDYGQEYVLDVRDGLPFEDGSVEAIRAAHFLEHLTQDEAVAFMNECWRVLADDGVMVLAVPHCQRRERAYVFGHRSYYTEATFDDLANDYWHRLGVRRWHVLSNVTNARGDIHCQMRPWR